MNYLLLLLLYSLASTGEQEALEISLGTLGRTPDGRNATLETRLAMQRELDAARSQLRASERTCDDLRRQAVASREEVGSSCFVCLSEGFHCFAGSRFPL